MVDLLLTEQEIQLTSMRERSETREDLVNAREIDHSLQTVSMSCDDEEEPAGCKVILEDVYLESVSSYQPARTLNKLGYRSGVRVCACGIFWRK